jgi:hypothetical protein
MSVFILLSITTAVMEQDTSKISIAKNNQWTSLLESDTSGDFTIRASTDGKVAIGETYTITIASEIVADESFKKQYENKNVKARGEDSLTYFGVDRFLKLYKLEQTYTIRRGKTENRLFQPMASENCILDFINTVDFSIRRNIAFKT